MGKKAFFELLSKKQRHKRNLIILRSAERRRRKRTVKSYFANGTFITCTNFPIHNFVSLHYDRWICIQNFSITEVLSTLQSLTVSSLWIYFLFGWCSSFCSWNLLKVATLILRNEKINRNGLLHCALAHCASSDTQIACASRKSMQTIY